MERSYTEQTRTWHKSGVDSGDIVEPNSSNRRSGQSTIRYGLALLFVALGVGLAAALFLTIGTAHAAIFLAGANPAF